MLRRQSYTSVVQASEKRKVAEREHLRHKILYRWGILVFVGVFSFLYWFILIPLLAPILPANWFLIGPIAFIIWLIIIAPFLWLWHYKQKTLVSLHPPLQQNNDSPPYPTKASIVQPISETKPNPSTVSQENCVWVPVQPGNVTPSLYNSQTGRNSFQSGYQLDEMLEKSSVEEKTISRNNSAVQLSKKFDTETKLTKSHRLISVSSSSSTELGGLDFKKMQRDPGDGLDAGEDDCQTDAEERQDEKDGETEKEECVSSSALDSVDSEPLLKDASEEAEKARLDREQSFKGLPEMQNFGEYLHLVTVDTPMSPRDAFFSDLSHNEPQKDNSEFLRQQRKSYHPGGDLSDVQRRIAEARKSLPPLFHYPDLEIGETRVLKTTTLPYPTVLKLEDEQPLRQSYVRSVSESRKHSWEAVTGCSRCSGEFFVADATRLDSVTSEAQVTIDPNTRVTQLSRWERVVSGAHSSSRSSSAKTDYEEPIEGRYVILSKDYASNNLEAFIRIEQESMSKEKRRAIFSSEDADDSVFLDLGH